MRYTQAVATKKAEELKAEKVLVRAGLIALALYLVKRATVTPKIYYMEKLPGNYNGFIAPPFGIFILESQRGNEALLKHELKHWEQYQDKGLMFFYLNYGLEFLQYGYDLAPMEIQARYEENEFCKTNYTECVRTGKARTVYNPDFRK